MRCSVPVMPKRHCAAAMSMMPSGCRWAPSGRIAATRSRRFSEPAWKSSRSSTLAFKARAAAAESRMLSGSKRAMAGGASPANSAGCSSRARKTSMPTIFSAGAPALREAWNSSAGLAAAMPGSVAMRGYSISSNPWRGPRMTRSASPASCNVARRNSAAALALTRCTEKPSATPLAMASTASSVRPGAIRSGPLTSACQAARIIPGGERRRRAGKCGPRMRRRSRNA